MRLLDQNQLEQYFKDYGWSLHATGPDSWESGFSSQERYFPVLIHLNETCLSLEICPLIDEMPLTGLDPLKLYRILQLNNELQLVKLGINDDGKISLCCQLLSVGINYLAFSQTLEIIGYYCDEISKILSSNELPSTLYC